MMPGMDGYEVCRRIRENPETAYLPVVMITASDTQEKVRAIEAGADDFVTKPFDQAELLARVKSLVRVKRYQDTIRRQAAELEAWNRQLEERVAVQVAALERATRLRRFLSPQMAELILDSGDESFLESHRREIVVVFCDLRRVHRVRRVERARGAHGVLSEYHGALGDLVFRFEGTLERFTGDGLMVVFNDPCRATTPACEPSAWPSRCARGSATSPSRGRAMATISASASASPRATRRSAGSASRAAYDYTAIGTVVNLAARLCAVAQAVADPRHPASAHRRRGSRRPLAGR